MHPILFQAMGLTFYSYGLMVGLGILAGTALILARLRQQVPAALPYALPWLAVTVLAGLIGARVFYAFYFPAHFLADPMAFLLSSGGMVWYGSLFSGIAALLIQICRARQPLLPVLDAMLPPALLGLALGRIGCFLAGCCYGQPCPTAWYAVHYPATHATQGIGVSPVQLMESGGALGLLGLIIAVERWMPALPGQAIAGRSTGLFCVGYAVLRFLLETQRGDALLFSTLSASQWMSVFLGGIGTLLLLRSTRSKVHPPNKTT
jgi:phosphatidylglycerol---prolipoprotein diacylglyceryl transferase